MFSNERPAADPAVIVPPPSGKIGRHSRPALHTAGVALTVYVNLPLQAGVVLDIRQQAADSRLVWYG